MSLSSENRALIERCLGAYDFVRLRDFEKIEDHQLNHLLNAARSEGRSTLDAAMSETIDLCSLPVGEGGARIVIEVREETSLYEILASAWDRSLTLKRRALKNVTDGR